MESYRYLEKHKRQKKCKSAIFMWDCMMTAISETKWRKRNKKCGKKGSGRNF